MAGGLSQIPVVDRLSRPLACARPFLIVLLGLPVTGGHQVLARIHDTTLTVTPGNTSIERGGNLVILARFEGPLPVNVQLVCGAASHGTQRIPLIKSLADPMFGGSIPDLQSNLAYHVE